MLFSCFIIYSVFLVLSVDGVEFECNYRYDGCEIESVDLSLKTIGANFTFSGTQEQKQNITEMKFSKVGRVVHLPLNLFEEFLKLKELTIYNSEIPILKSNLFGPELVKIQKLWLTDNRIQIIEENACTHLTNLESISLSWNEIKSLSAKLFQNNHKLKVIYLESNKIKMIHPETFRSLNQLAHVYLRVNECIDFRGCQTCYNAKISELEHYLQPCYENHAKSFNFLNEGENNKEA